MKVVINKCYGGFGLSEEAIRRYFELKAWVLIAKKCREFPSMTSHYKGSVSEDNYWYDRDVGRDDPVLVQVVKELGNNANGLCASLAVIEIPDDVDWVVEEYDGIEWIAEKHRIWE